MTVADEHIRHHQWVHEQYEKAFAEIDAITVHSAPEEYMKPNYWLSTIRFEDGKHTVDGELLSLIQKLSDANIETRPLWKPMHLQPVYKGSDMIGAGDRFLCEKIFDRGLCLPSDIKNTREDMDRIITIIRSLFV